MQCNVKKEKRRGLTTSLTEFLRLPFLSKNKNLSIGEFRLIWTRQSQSNPGCPARMFRLPGLHRAPYPETPD